MDRRVSYTPREAATLCGVPLHTIYNRVQTTPSIAIRPARRGYGLRIKWSAVHPLLVAVLLLVPVAATAQTDDHPETLYRVSIGAVIGAHAADLITSELCIHSGAGVEANPLLKNPAALPAFKVATAAAQVWLTHKLHKSHPKTAVVLNLVTASLVTTVAAHNASIYTR